MLIYLHEKIPYPLENHQFFKNILVFIPENKEIDPPFQSIGVRTQLFSGRQYQGG
jgi:hypothetical protein